MSRKIHVVLEVRDMLIMKETLEQMGINYNKTGTDILSIPRSYHNIEINGNNNRISFDEANAKEVNKIKQTYMHNWYKDVAIKEGMQLTEEVNSKGEIVLHVHQ